MSSSDNDSNKVTPAPTVANTSTQQYSSFAGYGNNSSSQTAAEAPSLCAAILEDHVFIKEDLPKAAILTLTGQFVTVVIMRTPYSRVQLRVQVGCLWLNALLNALLFTALIASSFLYCTLLYSPIIFPTVIFTFLIISFLFFSSLHFCTLCYVSDELRRIYPLKQIYFIFPTILWHQIVIQLQLYFLM
jgi:hypothetical protein